MASSSSSSGVDINETDVLTSERTGFRAPIADAYAFRCLMDLIGATVTKLPIKIRDNNIEAMQADVNKTIFHHMTIDTEKLPDFYINPELDEIILYVSMRTLKNKIKITQKRTSNLTLFNNMDDANQFYAVIVVPHQKNNGTVIIETITGDDLEDDSGAFDYVNENGSKMKPSLVLTVNEVSRVLNQVTNTKCICAEFICYQKGILIRCLSDDKLVGIQTLGRCANPINTNEESAKAQNGPELCRYIIPNANLKPFNKLVNIAPSSATLGLFYSRERPLKVAFPIGTIGYHEIFLANVNPKTLKPCVNPLYVSV
jgi:hypothetical protein